MRIKTTPTTERYRRTYKPIAHFRKVFRELPRVTVSYRELPGATHILSSQAQRDTKFLDLYNVVVVEYQSSDTCPRRTLARTSNGRNL